MIIHVIFGRVAIRSVTAVETFIGSKCLNCRSAQLLIKVWAGKVDVEIFLFLYVWPHFAVVRHPGMGVDDL